MMLKKKRICITGTDTGIGKTVYTGLLAKQLSESRSVVTQKWVQCGDLDNSDIQTHDRISGIDYSGLDINHLRQVYSFQAPVSPHLAVELETAKDSAALGSKIKVSAQFPSPKQSKKNNGAINSQHLMDTTTELSKQFDTVLLETSGGIMVPIDDNTTTGDLVGKLGIPTIVVVANRLGAINHALLTLNYLESKKIPIIGFVINNYFDCPAHIKKDNPKIIEQISGVPCMDSLLN